MNKFPITAHLLGSASPKVMDRFDTNDLLSYRVLVQEKLDGVRLGITFSDKGDSIIFKNNRRIRNLKPLAPLQKWLDRRESMLLNLIGNRYVLYGQWLKKRQTVMYTDLPDHFIAHDLYDIAGDYYWANDRLKLFCDVLNISHTPTLTEGVYGVKHIGNLINKQSAFGDTMAGVYVRMDDDIKNIFRAQFVAPKTKQTGKLLVNNKLNANNLSKKS